MERLTKKQRSEYLKEHPVCVKCGKQATQVHHTKMISDGGSNDESNLKALCYNCHQDSDHAKCVGKLSFEMDEEGNITLKDDEGE